MITIWHYLTPSGKDLFEEWFDALADENAQARIAVRINRLAAGNFGDCKPLQEGVWELRIDWGPGYRVYYGMTGKTAVLLLCGGDKRKQNADIARAITCWKDYKERSKES
jgi:putative addiction module killer protein